MLPRVATASGGCRAAVSPSVLSGTISPAHSTSSTSGATSRSSAPAQVVQIAHSAHMAATCRQQMATILDVQTRQMGDGGTGWLERRRPVLPPGPKRRAPTQCIEQPLAEAARRTRPKAPQRRHLQHADAPHGAHAPTEEEVAELRDLERRDIRWDGPIRPPAAAAAAAAPRAPRALELVARLARILLPRPPTLPRPRALLPRRLRLRLRLHRRG